MPWWGHVGTRPRTCRPPTTRTEKGVFMLNALRRLPAHKALRIGAVAAFALGTVGALGMARAPATSARHCSPTVSKQFFGTAVEPFTGKPTKVFRYTLTSCAGMRVRLLTYGAIQQSITVPDSHGKKANVTLGFKTLKEYVAEDSAPPPVGGPYFGETIGRYGNRIAKGTFMLDRHTYTLPINNGVNSLHGGLVGFGNHVWASHAVSGGGVAGVRLKLVSPNGDDGSNGGCSCTGYPGMLTVHVTYTLNNRDQLRIGYLATVAGAATVLNLTNHSYFNLGGEASGPAYAQRV